MREDLVAQLEDQLIEAKIHLGFDFIVEKLFAENEKGVHRCIIVQIHRIKDVSEWKGQHQ
jgi:hypothetical protein